MLASSEISKELKISVLPAATFVKSVSIFNPDGSVPTKIIQNKTYKVKFEIRNDSDLPYYLGYNGVSTRWKTESESGYNNLIDNITWNDKVTIEANSTYVYEKDFVPFNTGAWWLGFYRGSDDRKRWFNDQPMLMNEAVSKELTITVSL